MKNFFSNSSDYLGYIFIMYETSSGNPIASFFDEEEAVEACAFYEEKHGVSFSWIGINLPVFLDDRRINSKEFI